VTHLRDIGFSPVRIVAMAINEDEKPIIKSGDDAREGVTGHHVRYVLGWGLAGAILALILIGVYFGLGFAE
jgi:hypothetical protein